jgi:hypothetical protein
MYPASAQIYNQWKRGFSTNPSCAFGGVASPKDIRKFLRMLLARGVCKGLEGQQHRVLSEASVKEMTTPQANTSGFGALAGGGLSVYVPYLLQSNVISPATAAVLTNVVFGNMWYGLGTPLSQVANGVAKNVVLIGGAGQLFMIANFQEPSNALLAGGSNFQNAAWGYTVSALLISEVLAALAA